MIIVIGLFMLLNILLGMTVATLFSAGSDKILAATRSIKSKDRVFEIPASDRSETSYKKIKVLLENALVERQYEDDYDDPTKSPYLRDLITAIAAVDPDKGLRLFAEIDTLYRGEDLSNFKASTASALAKTLKGNKKHEFIKLCNKFGDKKIALAAAYSTPVYSLQDLKAIATLVDASSVNGSLVLLLAAADLKDSCHEWKKALQMIKYDSEGHGDTDPLSVAIKIFRAYLLDDTKPLTARLRRTSGTSETERQRLATIAGVTIPLQYMLTRKTPAKPDQRMRYANCICEASKKIPSDQVAFATLGFVAKALGEKPTDCVAAQLKKRWRENHLKGSVSVEKHYAAFYAFEAMLSVDEKWATTVAEELIRSLLAQQNSRNYYHMVGTTAGALAGKNPERARKIAVQIRSLEWYNNALRCIYREWGKTDPEAALSAVKTENTWMEGMFNRRMLADLKLEAAVGASFVNPGLAADEIALLPNTEIRFTQGYCLIAPPMAREDLDRALQLLVPYEKGPLVADAATALAHILLSRAGINLDPTIPDFFPDHFRPRNLWPGPRVCQPIRF
jgi:hypothetical protein